MTPRVWNREQACYTKLPTLKFRNVIYIVQAVDRLRIILIRENDKSINYFDLKKSRFRQLLAPRQPCPRKPMPHLNL